MASLKLSHPATDFKPFVSTFPYRPDRMLWEGIRWPFDSTCANTVDWFLIYWTDEVFDLLVKSINTAANKLNAEQPDGAWRWKKVYQRELYQWLSLVLYMGVEGRRVEYKKFWNESRDSGAHIITGCMSLMQYE